MGEDYSLLLKDHADQMDRMLADWSSGEDELLAELNRIGDEWADDLEQTDEYYYRETAKTRDRLTDDIQLIERELERLKASFALNNEVLDYNCKVLKLREEERAMLAARQKRKICRLNDRYRRLKEECDRTNQAHRDEEMKLAREVDQLRRDCDNMERKYFSIKNANDRQLEDVCHLAETRIDELLKQVSLFPCN